MDTQESSQYRDINEGDDIEEGGTVNIGESSQDNIQESNRYRVINKRSSEEIITETVGVDVEERFDEKESGIEELCAEVKHVPGIVQIRHVDEQERDELDPYAKDRGNEDEENELISYQFTKQVVSEGVKNKKSCVMSGKEAEQRKVEKNLANKNYKGSFVRDAKRKLLDSFDNEENVVKNSKVIRDKNRNRNNSDAKTKEHEMLGNKVEKKVEKKIVAEKEKCKLMS